MRFPWVNVVLFSLLLLQLITGYLGFTNGRVRLEWILWLHGIGAYGLLLLLYWKGNIIFDAIGRKTKWTGRRVGFLGLVALLLLTIIAGLYWTFYGPVYLLGFSLISIHIYLAVALMLLLLWHSWHMRFVLRLRQTWDRRLFLQSLVTSVAGLVTWRAIGTVKEVTDVPGASRRFTGSYERGSFGKSFPTVSWIADRPDPVVVEEWRLEISGAVARPLSFTYDELVRLPSSERVATLDCTGGWYTTQVWRGVNLADLLEMAGINEEAKSVTVTAVSGYARRFRVSELRRYLLALAVAGAPLSHGHGFPARLVAPDQRGVNWVKWVTRLRVNRSSKFWQSPLPLR